MVSFPSLVVVYGDVRPRGGRRRGRFEVRWLEGVPREDALGVLHALAERRKVADAVAVAVLVPGDFANWPKILERKSPKNEFYPFFFRKYPISAPRTKGVYHAMTW